MTQLLMRRA